MKRKKIIMTPGPTNISEKYMQIMAEEFPHHRTNEFSKLFKKLRENLKKLLYLEKGEVLVFASSGTGAMESMVSNLFDIGEKVIVINIGFFGERFTTMATRYGLEVIELKYPLGTTYQLADVKQVLDEIPDVRGVFVTHHETSTGVINNLEELGTLLKQYDDILFIADSISGFIMHPLYMEEWGLDAVAGASQKGFLVAPGLSFVGLSMRAIAKAKLVKQPRFYFDYNIMLNYIARGQTPSTPVIQMIKVMVASTDDLLTSGLEQVWQHHEELKSYLTTQLEQLNLTIGVQNKEQRGNVCVVVELPAYADSKAVCDALDELYDVVIVPGLGEKADTTLRVGIIGPLEKNDMDIFINAFKNVFVDLYEVQL